jgi:hypothetical protein
MILEVKKQQYQRWGNRFFAVGKMAGVAGLEPATQSSVYAVKVNGHGFHMTGI